MEKDCALYFRCYDFLVHLAKPVKSMLQRILKNLNVRGMPSKLVLNRGKIAKGERNASKIVTKKCYYVSFYMSIFSHFLKICEFLHTNFSTF